MTASNSSSLSNALQRAVLTLMGVVLALSGFILMLGALLVGLVVAAVWFIWSLLRGKPAVPPVRFSWPPPRFGGMGRRGDTPPQGEVVDVQVREVPERGDGH
ncbi:MAG: hypothetical protein OEU93_00985 [Rubrivivax sp.]|nr:hypothetical protein [Rubrivivax sp.]